MNVKRIKYATLFLLLSLISLVATACLQVPDLASGEQSRLLGFFERKSGRILYAGVDGNIYTNDQGGRDEQAITADAAFPTQSQPDIPFTYYQLPAWAPNGQQVAFVRVQGAEQAIESTAILTTDLSNERSNLTEVFSSSTRSPIHLYWSPDNLNVSFLSRSPVGQFILQMTSADGERTQILDVGQSLYWSWAPDGQQVLMHANGATPLARLAFLSVQGDVVEQKLEYDLSPFQAPAWSPDGSRLALAGATDTAERAIIVTDNQGRFEEQIDELEPTQLAAFGWSPNGKKLAYISGANAGGVAVGQLRVHDVAGDSTRLLIEDQVVAFFWAPNSELLAYFVPLQNPNSDEEAQQQQALLLSLRLLDLNSGVSNELTVFQPTSAFLNIITSFDQYHRSAQIWAPDSNNLVISGVISSPNPEIMVVSTEPTLQPRVIANGLVAFWSEQ
ncbi:MAG: hypothetical protein AAF614_08905 [Chloroflexota bacterium]